MIFLVGSDNDSVTVADGNYVSDTNFLFLDTFGVTRAISVAIVDMYLQQIQEVSPAFWMGGKKFYYVVKVGNLDLLHRVAKACKALPGHAYEHFEIASRFSLGMKIEIMAYAKDDGIFAYVRDGMIGDEDFIPQMMYNSVQTPELPMM